jgi:serine/threonine protein kinase
VVVGLVLEGEKDTYSLKDEPFAHGRMSLLFEATTGRGAEVCAKVFMSSPEWLEGDPLAQFFRELNAQSHVKHPNILPVLDFGGLERPFLVLPMCRGGNLRSLMQTRDFHPLSDAIPILRQVASAIDAAHEGGIIHGDIKPENILFDDDQVGVYLSDFGISKYYAIEERFSTMTGPPAGTTVYLSPEQLSRARQSPRSDLYSFGMVAYELLTGTLPFDVKGPPFQQMLSKVNGALIDPAIANPALSPQARSALLAALKVDPNERPQTAAEFCQILASTRESDRTVVAQEPRERILVMGDQYVITGQAGAVGPSAVAAEMSFTQTWNEIAEHVDLAALAGEMTELRSALRTLASGPEHDIALAEVASAEMAAKTGDGPRMLRHLAKAGKWALEIATEIGAPVVTAVLKAALGVS